VAGPANCWSPGRRAAGERVLLRACVVDLDSVRPGYLGGGTVTDRPTSITWTLPSTDVPARQLVLAARLVADRLNPGGWIISADDYM